MWEILLGGISLSLLHAIIPNHWLPIVAVGEEQEWERGKLLINTFLIGTAHVASTILIGILVGYAGLRSEDYNQLIFKVTRPIVFLLFGIIYVGSHFYEHKIKSDNVNPDHQHGPHQSDSHSHFSFLTDKKQRFTAISLMIAMFFSPCLELELYYFRAAARGWLGILILSCLYMIITVGGMVVLVWLASLGVKRVAWKFLESREKLLIGGLFIALAILMPIWG